MKAVKLKPDIHMDSRLMYCVYKNQGQEPITPGNKFPDRFYNMP